MISHTASWDLDLIVKLKTAESTCKNLDLWTSEEAAHWLSAEYERWQAGLDILTLLILSRDHIRAYVNQQLQYRKDISNVDPNSLVSIDWMAHNAEEFLVGSSRRRCEGCSIVDYAAYCRFGFVAAGIMFEGTLSQTEVAYFLNVALKNALQIVNFVDFYVISDCVYNQSTELVHNCLKSAFGPEQFTFLSFPSISRAWIRHYSLLCKRIRIRWCGRPDWTHILRQWREGYMAAYNHFNLYDGTFEQWWPEDMED